MENLLIYPTPYAPEIDFNSTTGELKIKGRAFSNNMNKFFTQINEWSIEYLKNPQTKTTVILQLEYYNSSFFKLLFILLENCKKVILEGKQLVIKWRHQKDDYGSIEDAEEISAILNFPFQMEEVN